MSENNGNNKFEQINNQLIVELQKKIAELNNSSDELEKEELKQQISEIDTKLLQFNSGFLNKICRKYIVTTGFEDALQYAKLEFLKAARNFDFSKGLKFSTLSSKYIRNKMIYLENRLNKFNRFNKKLNDAYNALEAEGNYSPTYAELAYKMNMKDFDFAAMYLNMSQLSIDDQFREHKIGDFTTKIVDIIKDENVDIIQNSINKEISFSLYKGLKTKLTERELYFVIKHHVEKVKLEELGKEYGLTRERVRQIINNALKKLRVYLEKRIGSNCTDEKFTLY